MPPSTLPQVGDAADDVGVHRSEDAVRGMATWAGHDDQPVRRPPVRPEHRPPAGRTGDGPADMSRPRAERPTMPDYGVETKDWSPLPWSWAAERLARNRNYWVVTASGDARPHAMPVWGVWDDDDLRFAFSCGPRARKAANVRSNPYVVFTVDDTEECLSVEGQARFVEADDARQDVWVQRYLDKYRPVSRRPQRRVHPPEPRHRGRARRAPSPSSSGPRSSPHAPRGGCSTIERRPVTDLGPSRRWTSRGDAVDR